MKKPRSQDPFREREAERYPDPLPSREYILGALEEYGVPLTFTFLIELLEIRPHELEAFQRRLGAMQRDGQILQNRRGDFLLPDKADLVRGRVEGHPDGFGFLIREDGGEDLQLSPKEMEKVLHGDRVLAQVAGTNRRGRLEGRIIEVLERANHLLVGRVFNEHGVLFVVAENRRISQDILLAPGGKRVRSGQVVMVEIVEQPSRRSQPIGKVVEILGDFTDPGMEIEIALRKHDLPFQFSPDAMRETRKLPRSVRKSDWAWKGGSREDLRHLPLVTIDDETAKDFDDAVYCESQGKDEGRGFRLLVAIADVSHYVEADQALDQEAFERGNSVYFPRRVIPMLPEKLSNGLCSLNPEEDRLCMACDMTISANGAIQSHRFYPAIMRSHARLSYNEVAQILDDEKSAAATRRAKLLVHLQTLAQLYRVLAKARRQRGAIDFDSNETRILFNDEGKIASIEPVQRNDAHRLIEECMLAANVCAARFLQKSGHAFLYRIHAGPKPEKLDKLREFLREFGLSLEGGAKPQAGDYAKLLEQIRNRPDQPLLQMVMLRSLQQALYSPDNVGHFGLAYEAYTHFTSPIRRYPDLLVHRAIKAALRGEPAPAGDLEAIGLHCSHTERRADEATREVESWLKCFYMQDRIGECFEGNISSVTSFGAFILLDDVFIEGLVHISDLGNDYFHFDEIRHQLLGERTGIRYRLTDRVKVELIRVDLETRRIDFRLAETDADHSPSKKSSKRRSHG